MTNINISLLVRQASSAPDNTWFPCGDNGAGYFYRFHADSDGSWDPTNEAFIFPDGPHDSITFFLETTTATMFHLSALIIFQQPGQGRNRDKATMVKSTDINITSYANQPTKLVLADTNPSPGNQQRTGYFKVLVHHVKDSNGDTLTNPVGFIACDPFWEDN